MRAALAASVALALLIAPFAFGERVQEKDRRLEASGLARLGDRLLFVDDSVRGAYFSVPVERAEGVLELSRDAAQRHKLNGAREASDLEGIAVIDDEVFVLSEELHALFNAQGRVYEYALRFGPLAKRGMEGVALRRASNGVVEVAAVWEGGRYSKSALMPDLVPLLAGAVPQPIVVLHALCEGGAVGKQEEDDGARTVELLLAAAIDGAQGFRAKDLVWFTNAAGAHELIVLLTSRTETRLQRFDLAGRPVGRALDFGAWLAEHGLEKLRDKDWEGMTWWEPGEVLALVHDAARKGKTRVVFLPLPEALRRTPVVDEATRIHQSALVFDGHNDLPWVVR